MNIPADNAELTGTDRCTAIVEGQVFQTKVIDRTMGVPEADMPHAGFRSMTDLMHVGENATGDFPLRIGCRGGEQMQAGLNGEIIQLVLKGRPGSMPELIPLPLETGRRHVAVRDISMQEQRVLHAVIEPAPVEPGKLLHQSRKPGVQQRMIIVISQQEVNPALSGMSQKIPQPVNGGIRSRFFGTIA